MKPLASPTAPLARSLTTRVEPRFDAEITYLEITNDGMVRHPSFKRLVPWLRSRLRHSSGPHGSRLPEHLWEKVLFQCLTPPKRTTPN